MVAFGIQHLLKALISFQLGAVVCGSPTLTSPAAVPAPLAIRGSNFATEARPSSGTEPPSGAVLVSADGSIANSFTTLNDAIWSLPNDTSSQVIFIYPGTYVQQSKIKRNGTVTVIGYQLGDVGKTYSGNQVTLSFKRGLSVATSIPGTSNSDTAVMYTSSTGISFYNVNFINTDNLDGAISSYVTLASATYGDHIAYYGCSFVGWQDTLLTGNRQGSSYYESSYIDGAIDFIWGYGLGYFKGCTIAAKRAKGYFTAHNRLNATSHGAYVFDQCLFTKGNTTANLTASVYLGRPWSQYAKVIIKDSYLDDIIKPAGWSQWSTSSPNLDGVTFAEYNNVGPGNWENNAAAREAFGNATLLTEDTYKFADVVGNTTWIDLTYFDGIVTPTPA